MIKRCMDVHVKSVISAQKETWKRSQQAKFWIRAFSFYHQEIYAMVDNCRTISWHLVLLLKYFKQLRLMNSIL